MKRAQQLLLILTFLPLCWLAMQAVHESGHIAAALLTGGTVAKVVLHPLTISRTDTTGSAYPLTVIWGGPTVGVLAPLALWALLRIARVRPAFMARFFAGTCLIANGAYLAVGSWQKVGDAGDLIRLGSPRWALWLCGALAVPLGLYLWNGLGPSFGLGPAAEKVDRAAAYLSAALLALVLALELSFSPPQ